MRSFWVTYRLDGWSYFLTKAHLFIFHFDSYSKEAVGKVKSNRYTTFGFID